MHNKLETKIVFNKPGVPPVGAIIWLHGLGADCNDFVPLVAEMRLTTSLKFVFPNAPQLPITINNGLVMRAWYDITDFSDLHREVDSQGITTSLQQIDLLIQELIAEGFKPQQIIIAGFSQGGVMAYYSGLTSSYTLGGVIVLSAYLPDLSLIDLTTIKQKRKLPLLICHGTQDQVVSIQYAKMALEHLQRLAISYEWHEYPMPHSVCYEEIMTIAQWLQRIFDSSLH